MKISIETTINAPIDAIWNAWTTPADIMQWNSPSDDWHTTSAAVDLRSGGAFSSRMEAKDGSFGFDFAGTFTKVEKNKALEYALGDERTVQVEFIANGSNVTIRETFDSEPTHSIEQQREGWQAILDRFAQHVVAKNPR
jgi:uncharacterized protein YndB with AHSA1/START domain